MTIRKFTVGSKIIRSTRSIFWNTENRQAIDNYDDSEKGHVDFIWIQDSIVSDSVTSAENLFQDEHFHQNLKLTAVRVQW